MTRMTMKRLLLLTAASLAAPGSHLAALKVEREVAVRVSEDGRT